MPGKEAQVLDCDFPNRWNETVSEFIEPVTVNIQLGDAKDLKDEEEEEDALELWCHAYPNASLVRRWVFFQEGGKRQEVSSSKRTMAGDVQFLSDTRDVLTITPRSIGE